MYALATTTFAWLIFLIFVLGYAGYVLANLRSSRPEIGSSYTVSASGSDSAGYSVNHVRADGA